jgi:arsenate reductase (thioredoxin)
MPTVLFVCTENACRSQMAEGWARKLLPDWQAFSAGSRPRGSVDPNAIAVMQEVGIDISGQSSKGFDDLGLGHGPRSGDTIPNRSGSGHVPIGSCPAKFDYVVTMGCKDGCPFVPAKQTLDWNIPDPAGKDLDFYRKVRGLIRDLVKHLPEAVPAGLSFNL